MILTSLCNRFTQDATFASTPSIPPSQHHNLPHRSNKHNSLLKPRRNLHPDRLLRPLDPSLPHRTYSYLYFYIHLQHFNPNPKIHIPRLRRPLPKHIKSKHTLRLLWRRPKRLLLGHTIALNTTTPSRKQYLTSTHSKNTLRIFRR